MIIIQIARLGAPRLLCSKNQNSIGSSHNWLLPCGIKFRFYSLQTSAEIHFGELSSPVINIRTAPVPYDPNHDLVARDLSVIPDTINRIDKGMRLLFIICSTNVL